MSDQTDMDQVRDDLQRQSVWGQPMWYGLLLRVVRVVNVLRQRTAATATGVDDHETRIVDLESRVAALEQPPDAPVQGSL